MPKTIALFCAALLLSACGQTGALYLPDKGPPKRHAKAVPVKVVAPSSATDSDGATAPAAPAPNPAPDGGATPTPAGDTGTTPPAQTPAQ